MAVGYKWELTELAASLANKLGLLDGYRGLRKRLVKPQAAILMYHRVELRKNPWFFPYSVMVSDFENQLKYLVRHYTVISLEELVNSIYENKPFPSNAAVITFDDGYKDNYRYAFPIIKKYGVPASIFLTTGPMESGELLWWDKIIYVLQRTARKALEIDSIGAYPVGSGTERLRATSRLTKRLFRFSEPERNALLERIVALCDVKIPTGLGKETNLTWDEVREMNRNGITFGAHSVTHPLFSKLSPEEARREIVQSKKDIEENIDESVTAFSYPGGRFSDETTRVLKENGFRCALTSVPGMITSGANPYELSRILGGWTYAVFKAMLSGLYPDLNVLSHRNNTA
jgi:peptidoglycan/xylan/chitin deacetylase (PgdA/CDA1 family)